MKFAIFLLVPTLLLVVESKTLYDLSQPCQRNDSNFKNCFANLIETAASRLVKGVPELQIPPMDPYIIPYFTTTFNVEDIARGEVVFRNMIVTNIMKLKVEDINMDLDNLSAVIDIVHPKLTVEWEFEVHGKFVKSPFQVEGNLRGKLADCKSNLRIKFKTVEREGVEYLAVDNLKLDVSIEDGFVQFTTDNAEYRSILNSAQRVFNENPKLYVEMGKLRYMKHLGNFMKSIMDAIFGMIPASMILS